jgi:uncharacterized protein YbdZ (MbtH family)
MISKLFARALPTLMLVLAPMIAIAAGPAAVAVSEPLRLSGTLSVQIEDDFEARKARTVYSLVVRPGYRLSLDFAAGAPAGLRTGMKVQASGRFDGQRLRVDAEPGAFRIDAVQSPAASAPAAARKVLIVLTDIVDGNDNVNRVEQSCDAADISADIMFGTKTTLRHVDGAYRASSYDALGIGGAGYPGNGLDVLRVQVRESALYLGGVCNYDDWANQADALVAAAGVAPGDFQHRTYVFPSTAGCGWAGLGELSCGADCRAWQMTSVGTCGTRGAHAHELGHNLGLMHASSDWYNDGIGIDEYGDLSDFMGYAENTVHQTNALHQLQLGWLGVTDLPGDGTFTVSPSSVSPAAHPQLYRLTPPSGLPYYFSYRMGVGYDEGVFGGPLSIHRWAGGQANTIYITTLHENDSFFDAGNGLVVTMLSQSADGAVFTVTRGGTCTRAAPTVGVSPSSISTTAVPATGTYTVTVRNNDSNACGSSTFAVSGSTEPWLQSTGQAGWQRIAPGATASFNFGVSANAATANGTYAISVGTTGDGDHPAVLASASYIVDVSPVCIVRAPTGQMYPAAQTVTQLPATDVGFGAKINNNDSGSSCTESQFPVSVTVPQGWSETHSPSTLSIPAVGSGVSNIHVSVPTGTPNGTYPIIVNSSASGGHGAISFSGSITVAVDPNACFRQAPSTVLSPSAVSTSTLPKSWSVTLSVQNRDSGGGCAPSTFSLGTYSEAGWAMSMAPSGLTIAPGATAEATLSFTAPAGTGVGTYQPLALVTDAVHGQTGAAMTVQVLAGDSCTRAAPGIALSPTSQSLAALPGTRNYTVTVSNKDSAGCVNSSLFPLVATVPAGWSAQMTPLRLTLVPGASGTATMAVTAPAGTANGTYAVTASTRADSIHPAIGATGNLVVSVSGGSCTAVAPLVALSPATQTASSLPKALAYSLSVTNRDSAGCASSSFPLSKQVPTGWTASVSPSSLTLAPGASATATFTATAPTGTANGSYGVSSGTSAAGSHAANSATATAVVNVTTGADTTPPTKPGNLTGKLVSGQVVLNWSASTDAGSGLANYKVYRNGVLFATITANSLTKLVSRGSWTFYVTAVDKAGNVSEASNSVVVTK